MNRKSIVGFLTSYRWSAYITPKSPKGGSQSNFLFLFYMIQFQLNKVCYKVSLCENVHRQSCSNGPSILARNVTL